MTDGFPFTHRLSVRFRDCDALGHVNNAVYFTYLEQCRLAWWHHLGGSFGDSPGLPGGCMIIAHAECDYRSPAYMDDELDIDIKLGTVGRSSFTLIYAIVNAANAKRVADAKTVSVTFDYTLGRSVPIPEATLALLDKARG
jgi:acyl-CoA thioester hydrolase